jgi:hypothetical protein
VPDSPLESWRLRRVEVLLYLEDGTMQVTEPHAPNSGITQVRTQSSSDAASCPGMGGVGGAWWRASRQQQAHKTQLRCEVSLPSGEAPPSVTCC